MGLLLCDMLPPTGDAELVRRIAAEQDRSAFAVLFRRFAPRLAGFFDRQRLQPGVRDDLIQEVMLRIWRHAHRYDEGRATVTTWIFTIARNARIDHFRKQRAIVDPLDPTYVDELTPRADAVAQGREEAKRLRGAIAELPEAQSNILKGAYFDHKSLREIAEEEGVPLGTVKSRVRLAMSKLRDLLGVEA